MTGLSPETRLKLVPLQIRPERGRYVVEDVEAGEYYEMPPSAVEAIRLLEDGHSLDETERLIRDRFPGEDADLLEFAGQLLELELVQEVDGCPIERRQSVRLPTGIRRRGMGEAGGRKLGRFLAALLAIAGVYNAFVLIAEPALFPQPSDLFIGDSLLLNTLYGLMLSLGAVLWHETGHLLAVRAYGLPARLGIGHRYFLVVLETEMPDIWRLPPRSRIAAYLAGMGFDQALLAVCLTVQLAADPGSGFWLQASAFLILDLVIKTIYQGAVFMKTDLYYVLETSSGRYHLMEDAKEWWRGVWAEGKALLKSQRQSGSARPSTSKIRPDGVIRLYTVVYGAGWLLMGAVLAGYLIPQLILIFHRAVPRLLTPGDTVPFWDAVGFLFLLAAGGGLLLRSWLREARSLDREPTTGRETPDQAAEGR